MSANDPKRTFQLHRSMASPPLLLVATVSGPGPHALDRTTDFNH